MNLLKLFLTLSLTFFAAASIAERNPVGEKASYFLDNSSARTTSMIRSGKATALVTKYLPDQKAFNTKLTYDLNIDWVGRKTGETEMAAPEEYFQPDFIEKLRRDKKIVLPKFTVTHLGFSNARNPDGKIYKNCDKVLISDIKEMHDMPFVQLLEQSVFYVATMTDQQIENLKVLVHYSPEVPVLGAAKIDLSGKASGFDFKAGFDFKP